MQKTYSANHDDRDANMQNTRLGRGQVMGGPSHLKVFRPDLIHNGASLKGFWSKCEMVRLASEQVSLAAVWRKDLAGRIWWLGD